MSERFESIAWDDSVHQDLAALLPLALDEDLGTHGDWTSLALVDAGAMGGAHVVVRQPGTIAGLPAAEMALAAVDSRLDWQPNVGDGAGVVPGQRVARVAGPVRSLLAAERLVLNLLGRLSGIATLTRHYVEAVAGTGATVYDTRKTTPAWRRLEKYAVRCGGGRNHRTGLFDAVLIKDNHLAAGGAGLSPSDAVRRARDYVQRHAPADLRDSMIVEVEVDTLAQLADALTASPDIILLDNMSPERLGEAVALRNARNPRVELEASGGIDLETVRAVAASGVERISVGALTHSSGSLDVGLDWLAKDVAES